MNLPCVFNFPSLVHCESIKGTLWKKYSGTWKTIWVFLGQMDLPCPNMVCGGHMTWYIARNIQNKPSKSIVRPFSQFIQNVLGRNWSGTLWSHDLGHFECSWQCPRPVHGGHICLVHLKCTANGPLWYVLSSWSQSLQCTCNGLAWYIASCPQWYHKISMQGKLNLYDFYTATMQKTDNRGHLKIKVCWPVGSAGHATHTINSIGITRCRGASDNGVTSKISNVVRPATPLQQLTTLAMGLSQSSAQHVHIQGEICLRSGRMHPRTKCTCFSYFSTL